MNIRLQLQESLLWKYKVVGVVTPHGSANLPFWQPLADWPVDII
jgi:hypothetical protein